LDEFVITCRGVDRGNATPESLALIRGGRHEAGKNPSRATKLHRAIYARHPGVKSIINAMPVNATAFAVTGEKLDARTIPESYIFLREVETLPFGVHLLDPERVADLITPESPVMLIENDGVLVLGRGVLDAFDRLEVLESTAEALINSRAVGPVHPMPEEAIRELVTTFVRPWD
jgi:L-fuculose-phosphate aldolase